MPVIIWGLVWQKQVSRAGTSNYIPQILWDVITCPCPWYLFLTHCHHMSQTGMQGINNYIPQNAVSICSISHKICTWFYHALFRMVILSAHCDSLRWNYPYPSRLPHWYWAIVINHPCIKLIHVAERGPRSLSYSHCHGCWWCGDTRRQGISRYGIDLNNAVSTLKRWNCEQ